LFFESRHADSLPAKSVIEDLGRLAAEFNLSYNAHLPTDVSISAKDTDSQKEAVETMIQVIDCVHPLDPSALILHIPYDEVSLNEAEVGIWQNRVHKNLVQILSAVENSNIIAIETLNYSLDLLEGLITELDLSICLDLGHLMVYDFEISGVFNRYASKTGVLHVHGVENGRDHLTLNRLPEKLSATILQVLKRFTGVVSLEVFSFEDLVSSLKFLEKQWVYETREGS
jgi:sugar phosphate isomerase/epimerase